MSTNFKFKFILSILTLLAVSSWAQEEKWVFLPPAPLFHPLLADPREPNNSLDISPDTTRYDLSLGGSMDLVRWEISEDQKWGIGMMGAGYLKIIRYDWASYRLEDSDLWYGLYLSQSSGKLSNRLEFQHGSSHLGDWLFGTAGNQFPAYGQIFTDQQAFLYERDLLQWTLSYQLFECLRVYGGAGYWLYSNPSAQPLFLHLGLESFTNSTQIIGICVRGFIAYDFKREDELSGINDQNFQIGIVMKPSKEALSESHLVLDYYNGNSEYGQFYLQRDNHLGFEISFMP